MPGTLEATRTPRGKDVSAIEHFDVAGQIVALEALPADKKKGRLARMVYEFETGSVLNKNRRIYPAGIVKMAVEALDARCKKGQVYGRVDHPAPWSDNAMLVTAGDAATLVVSAEMMSETKIKVTHDVLDNEHGEQLMSIVEAGGNPGTSQRALVRWRDPTVDERKQYGIPDNTFVDVAEAMRLITYDIVSEPGFVGADGATVTEQSQPSGADEMKTPAELKAQNAELYNLVFAEGKAAGLADVDSKVNTAVAAAKTTAATEAIAPLNAKITELQGNLKIATDALAGVKDAQTKLKIVNEQVTDAQAATRIATAEARVATLEGQIAALNKDKETLGAKVAEGERFGRVRKALESVAAQYATHPAKNLVLQRIARQNIEDTQKALEAARVEVLELEAAFPNLKGQTQNPAGGGGGGNPGQFTQENLLNGLLDANPQNPGNGSGGGAVPGFDSLRYPGGSTLGAGALGGLSLAPGR